MVGEGGRQADRRPRAAGGGRGLGPVPIRRCGIGGQVDPARDPLQPALPDRSVQPATRQTERRMADSRGVAGDPRDHGPASWSADEWLEVPAERALPATRPMRAWPMMALR